MGCNKLLISSSSILLFCQSLLVLIIIPIIAFSFNFTTELKHYCSSRSYDPDTSNYSLSLVYLVNNLCVNAPTNNGFWNASWAQDSNSTAYGLALCQGDLSRNDCEMCLINVTNMVVDKYCPNSRGAIILNDYCMLKYSDIDFRGQIDSKLYYFYRNATVKIQNLTNVAIELLNNLSQTAITRPDNKFFANGGQRIYTKIIGNCTVWSNAPVILM
ncbi:hypothetical protein CASFOL_040966 [Castilleja foliolosa]|uniref:Gnk2-homologous domain-containing protein n=1 Tax=Castilleja foliolosa TaxID=1961234 RepID=A0ABD3BD42_9LAMI